MDCRSAKELLSAFLDGETSAEESSQVEEHLAACAECGAAQRRLLALDEMIARSETGVSPGFRDALFSRMEAEELLPRRTNLFSLSVRWALPLAAAAALGLFLMMSREAPRGPSTPGNAPQVAVNRPDATPSAPVAVPEELTAEDREIVAYLEVLEDPSTFEGPGEIDEMEIFLPTRSRG